MNQIIKPEYYHINGIDVIEYAKITFGYPAAKSFCRINVLKYVVRYEQKNGIEDLNKAITYLTRLIELEREEDESTY